MKTLPIKELNGATVKVSIVPTGNKDIRPQNKMNPEYITVHNTGNANEGADALMHEKYLINQAKGKTARTASWHFTVDDKYIVQHIPLDENAWHAGDGGKGTGNRKSIGIEICENPDMDYKKAEENAIALIVYLMKELNIPIDRVVPHKHWSGKQCPRVILGSKEGWTGFHNRIKKAYEASKGKASTAKKSTPASPSKQTFTTINKPLLRRGSTGKYVRELQTILSKLGYCIVIDGIFGQGTEYTVKQFQKKHGLAVDGIVGRKTWAKLLEQAEKNPNASLTPPYKIGVTTANVWLHNKPDVTEKSRVRVLKKGERHRVFGEVNGMYRVGTNAFVSKKYVKIVE
jgi:N-acetylmuramoyl-L-alanine amidase